MRLHPAESRIRKLAAETPAEFMLFDLLALGGKPLADRPLARAPRGARALPCRQRVARPAAVPGDHRPRRRASAGSSAAAARSTASSPSGSTSPTGPASARCSRSSSSAPPTASSAASATPSKKQEVGSLLLGLYDEAGLLHHVGFTSALKAEDRAGADRASSKR